MIKFATRIPIFMYLTDYREYCLEDVITQLEPTLFKKVTGLDVRDFNLLCELNLFNKPLMNDALADIYYLRCCNMARKIKRLTGKDFPNIRHEIRQNSRHGENHDGDIY